MNETGTAKKGGRDLNNSGLVAPVMLLQVHNQNSTHPKLLFFNLFSTDYHMLSWDEMIIFIDSISLWNIVMKNV